ncbi:hypothetical protein, variant [Aphanomyces invadans]|uniref:Uncharacterized protein n=2 Tax=Aphanomyces invadans TaxID=157072 RepID=A0A024UIK2_9STRA|nr:hypothetical protein, variant [Aphanomyces invadans]ETW06010.1 hypothetical protein, variant [Aphanomyces invadans]|eukprot:XP_008865787.1 hypothetical protein, variant [Aphanomyces invadans]
MHGKLLVCGQDSLRVYGIAVLSSMAPSTYAAAASCAPAAVGSSCLPLLRQPTTASLAPLITQFTRQSPIDTSPEQFLTSFSQLSKLVRVAEREDLLVKLTALTIHNLHRAWPHSMRQLLHLVLRQVQFMSTPCVDTFTRLLKECPHTTTTKQLPAMAIPRYCATIQSLRDGSAGPHDVLPPWAVTLAANYRHTFRSTPNELDAWIPMIRSYDVRKIFHHVDVALLRRDPQDLRFLRLVATVLVLHLVDVTPFVPSVGFSSLATTPPRMAGLTMWSHCRHHPQWTLSTATKLATVSNAAPFLVTFCSQFFTSHTDEFVTSLCRQHPQLIVPTVVRCHLRQVCRVYGALRLLPYHPRRKRFRRASDSTIQDARAHSSTTARPGLSTSRFYRLYTMQPEDADVASTDESIAAHFAVHVLRHIKRFVLLVSPSPSVFSSLESQPPSTAQMELAHRIDPDCAWRFIDTTRQSSTAMDKGQGPLLAAFAWTAWACIARELAGDAPLGGGRIESRHGCWHVARLSSAVVFGKSDLDIRTAQIQSLSHHVHTSPVDAMDVLAFVTIGAKPLLAKRTSALITQCNNAVQNSPSKRSLTVEDAQAWMSARLPCRENVNWNRVASDPWFWAFCAALTDLETASVQECRTMAPPVAAVLASGMASTDATRQAMHEAVTKHPLRLLHTRQSQSEVNVKQRSPSVVHVLKLLQLQRAQHVSRPSSGETHATETQTRPTKPTRMEPLTETRRGVQPLACNYNDSTTQEVALKLLRKSQRIGSAVALRPRDFRSAPSLPRLPQIEEDVVAIAENSTQTIDVNHPVEGPTHASTETSAQPAAIVTSTATMTAPVPTADSTVVTDPPPPTITQATSTATYAVPSMKQTVKFPVYVAVPPPHDQRQGFLHVADLDFTTTSQPSLGIRAPRRKPASPVDGRDAPVTNDRMEGQVDSNAKAQMEAIASASNSLRTAYDSVPMDDGVDDSFLEPTTGSTDEHDLSGTSRPAGSTTTSLARVASLQHQMQCLAERLQSIESFADAMESEFAHSHEMLAQIQDRRRGVAGLLDSGFPKKLQSLVDATSDMQRSLDVARDNLVHGPHEMHGKASSVRRTSALAKRATDGMAQAKQLLRQLETTLHMPAS